MAAKVYDGNTVASVTPGLLSGIVGGDTVGVSATGSFDTRNAGIGKTVSIGLVLTGADAGNYSLATPSLSARGDIAPRTLTVTALEVAPKVFDGQDGATVTRFQLSGMVAGDELQATPEGRFADATVGIGKPVSVTRVLLTGADAGNYRVELTGVGTTADLLPPPSGAAQQGVVAAAPAGNGTATAPATAPAAGAGGASPGAGSAALNPPAVVEGAGSPGATGTASTASTASTSGAAGTGTGGTAPAAGTGATPQERSRVGTQPTLGLEQLLSGDGRVSVATGGASQPVQTSGNIPVTQARGSAAATPVGQFRVADLGDSLSLTPVSPQPVNLPPADGRVRLSGEALVGVDAGQQAAMRFTLTEEGLLRVVLSREAAGMAPDALAALAIATLKRSQGVGASEVRALALVVED